MSEFLDRLNGEYQIILTAPPPHETLLIRAECYHVDDLFTLSTEKAIKEAGKLRSEGKNYTMQDGDVVNFLFNV